ncbi:MAG: hypothetical protein ACTS7E_03865 [Arsenophonus sp. NC-CH8-MAG3]
MKWKWVRDNNDNYIIIFPIENVHMMGSIGGDSITVSSTQTLND